MLEAPTVGSTGSLSGSGVAPAAIDLSTTIGGGGGGRLAAKAKRAKGEKQLGGHSVGVPVDGGAGLARGHRRERRVRLHPRPDRGVLRGGGRREQPNLGRRGVRGVLERHRPGARGVPGSQPAAQAAVALVEQGARAHGDERCRLGQRAAERLELDRHVARVDRGRLAAADA